MNEGLRKDLSGRGRVCVSVSQALCANSSSQNWVPPLRVRGDRGQPKGAPPPPLLCEATHTAPPHA
eukprot:scaffold3992_cov137-Isochrysis_galbana.AAC.2